VVELLLEWLARYGYATVFVAATLENVFPIGFAVPGEIIVLTAALASSAARLNPVVVAILAATGETIGELLSYALGRLAGPAAENWITRRSPRTGVQIDRAQAYFRKRGPIALVLGRPAWGIKAVLPLVAGMSGMPFWKTAALVTISSLYWYPLLVALAYWFGLSVTDVAEGGRALGIALTALIVIAGGVAIARSRARRSR